MAACTPNTNHSPLEQPQQSQFLSLKVSLIIKFLMIELFTNSQQMVTSIYIKEREIQVSMHMKKEKIREIFIFIFIFSKIVQWKRATEMSHISYIYLFISNSTGTLFESFIHDFYKTNHLNRPVKFHSSHKLILFYYTHVYIMYSWLWGVCFLSLEFTWLPKLYSKLYSIIIQNAHTKIKMNSIKLPITLSIKGKANHTSIGRVSGPSFASLTPNKKSSSE